MNWFFVWLSDITSQLIRLFTTPLFKLGDTSYSLSLILTLVLVTLAVFWIARVISNWIKQSILLRMRMDRGTREVVATFIRYFLTMLGCLIVLQTIGVNLNSLTLLAGVVGIGIGFGLQNLASNFISGITLLFEQPIRVGDFIEVGNLLGTVETISFRSTTVRTLDGVFVIVPNIRFVENNIINWSYRDPRCRIHLPVDVACTSDPLLVTEALLEAARKDSRVLLDPPPRVWFRGFKEGDFLFELLVWINQPAESEPIKSSLNFLIERELRQQGIEIPYPQRELTIRNLDGWATNLQELNSTLSAQRIPHDPARHAAQKPAPPAPNNLTLRTMLRRISYFEHCSEAELLQLIEYGYRQLFPTDQLVCEEGAPGDSFYIILKGSVEIFSKRAEQYIATLNDGEFFGEMSVLLGIPRSATVRTLEDTILFVVERQDLQKLLEDHRGLADQIAQKLLERQQSLQTMGILTEFSDDSPLLRIRKRLQTLFGI